MFSNLIKLKSNPLVVCNELVKGVRERLPEANKYLVSVVQQLLLIPEGRNGLHEWKVLDIFVQHMSSLRGQTLTPVGLFSFSFFFLLFLFFYLIIYIYIRMVEGLATFF